MEWFTGEGLWLPLFVATIGGAAFWGYVRFGARSRPSRLAAGIDMLAFFVAPILALIALLVLDLACVLLMPFYLVYRCLWRGRRAETRGISVNASSEA
ncbi:MAG: hypothetical protein RL885_31750 [Planctomycetota bacterium]